MQLPVLNCKKPTMPYNVRYILLCPTLSSYASNMLLNLEQSRRSSRRRRVANAVATDDRLLREAAAGTQTRAPASGSLAPLRHLPILQDDSGSLRSRFLVPK